MSYGKHVFPCAKELPEIWKRKILCFKGNSKFYRRLRKEKKHGREFTDCTWSRPTAILNASLYGAIKEAKKYGKLEHIYGAENGTGGVLEEHFLALENVPEEKLELLLQTPGTAIGTSRDPIWQEDYEKMADILVKREIKYVLFNGGNGTMDTCGKLHKTCQARNLDIRVMGIPKTTDNDIAVTDHSPGFGSTTRYIGQTCTEELCVRMCVPANSCSGDGGFR